jgi:hypothetical protein
MFTMVEVTGTFETPEDGKAAAGTITATLERGLRNGTAEISPSPAVGHLDEEGKLVAEDGGAFKLPATDDVGTEPTGVQYGWIVELGGAPLRTFSAPLPHAVTPVDLSVLAPTP